MEIRSDERTEMFIDIDLSSLTHSETLSCFSLVNNGLKHLDLSPLSSCAELREFTVTGNSQRGPLELLDLSPLGSCPRLKVINLANNGLKKIDLSPLTSLTRLERLYLDSNRFQSIDLSPLSSCTSLYRFCFGDNQLETIDLSSLSSCASLAHVEMNANRLVHVDLAPLASCQCREVSLNDNNIERADITPLILNPSLERIHYSHTRSPYGLIELASWVSDPFPRRVWEEEEPTYDVESPAPKGSWELLRDICEIPRTLCVPVQTYVLNALGFQAFGLVDRDIREFLQSIPPQTTLDKAKEIVEPFLIETVCKQIDQGGTTVLLDVDSLMDVGEIAYRSDSILKLRDAEMKQVRISMWTYMGEHYMVGPLLLTAYGFSVLMNMRNPPLPPDFKVDQWEYERIQGMLRELGYDIAAFEDRDYDQEQHVPGNMSRQMRNYVLNLSARTRLDDSLYASDLAEALRKRFRAPQLRALLREHNLSSEGNKRDLSYRLVEAEGTDGVRRILEAHSE